MQNLTVYDEEKKKGVDDMTEITTPSEKIREYALHKIEWKKSLIPFAIYILILYAPAVIIEVLYSFAGNGYVFAEHGYLSAINDIGFLGNSYQLLLQGALTLGASMFVLAHLEDKEENILSGFKYFGKALGLMLFQTLFILLWTCLLIVPGIIAYIRYSQSFYILADDYTKGIRQCMNESKEMMKINKASYFYLMLTFLGWIILTAIGISIITGILVFCIHSNVALIVILPIVIALCMVPVITYISFAQGVYYKLLLEGITIEEHAPDAEGNLV